MRYFWIGIDSIKIHRKISNDYSIAMSIEMKKKSPFAIKKIRSALELNSQKNYFHGTDFSNQFNFTVMQMFFSNRIVLDSFKLKSFFLYCGSLSNLCQQILNFSVNWNHPMEYTKCFYKKNVYLTKTNVTVKSEKQQ